MAAGCRTYRFPFFITHVTLHIDNCLIERHFQDVCLAEEKALAFAQMRFEAACAECGISPKIRKDSTIDDNHQPYDQVLETSAGETRVKVSISKLVMPLFATEGHQYLVWHMRYQDHRGAAETVATRDEALECGQRYFRNNIVGGGPTESVGPDTTSDFRQSTRTPHGVVLCIQLPNPWSDEDTAHLLC